MEKKMKWGLATLLLLLGIAAVFLFIDKDTETKPKMTLGQPTKDLLEQGVKLPQQAKTPEAEQRPLPPDDGREYVWHGTHWDLVDASHEAEAVKVSKGTQQQSEVARSNFSVPGEVEFSQLPKLPADIDPDDIPPFHITEHDGTVYHYNRPLIPEERAMYSTLKSQRKSNPADLKVMAIVFVRQQKAESGTLTPIFQDLIDRKITSEEAEQRIAEFYEMTPAQKGGF